MNYTLCPCWIHNGKVNINLITTIMHKKIVSIQSFIYKRIELLDIYGLCTILQNIQGTVILINKQEDLLDLITALLKFKSSLSTTVAAQCRFQSSPWWFIDYCFRLMTWKRDRKSAWHPIISLHHIPPPESFVINMQFNLLVLYEYRKSKVVTRVTQSEVYAIYS